MAVKQQVPVHPQAGFFGAGPYPARRAAIAVAAVVAGFVLTAIWSAPFVDSVIGDSVANGILGHDAKATPISGVLAGTLFAFVSGLAGSFTACNIAAFGAVAPLVGDQAGGKRNALKPLGWISAGMLTVSVVYGVIVALVGTRMPQFSTAKTTGLSPRSIQSMIAFGVVGLVFLLMGLIALGILRNPFAGFTRRHPAAPLVLMGALIGGFLIGRPYPLFRIMFRDAAEQHNVLYGAAAFALQSLGNIVVMAVLFLILTYATGGRVQRWLAAKPARIATVTGVALLVGGTFTLLYWDVRVLGRLGIIWFPMINW
ncbi:MULTISPECIES: hypothetical protein [unclassified Amycolatopsis]|uniref:hypothetical protein n=1 Tax=unclassified Amycolatopsis TaxID=2618356 RepID=UPI002873F823|nr:MULTISPECIES: hypothetical protein [unclassified Amycolatopsis]MDS0139811.1 hypothetical protein [Amycolatopsis sp. 505]MDS0145234.1 hypothetical protein [Amycolatopsis sp. CM201R]